MDFSETKQITTSSVNDPYLQNLWGLSAIKASGVWSLVSSSSPVVVAVLDTGVDITHQDLAANIWTNPNEVAGDGVDNDNNGYVDDVTGWDFRNKDNNPTDDNNHGTHVAGTIAAVADNGIGVAGVNPYAKILPLKFMNSEGQGSSYDALTGIKYAVSLKKAGANIRVINMSFSGAGYNYSLDQAIQEAADAGILIVAAAGNKNTDNDSIPAYPSSYSGFTYSYSSGVLATDNVISVAASTQTTSKASFSSYGSKSVDVAAPGDSILSTLPNNTYSYFNGTSMAAPHVSAAASLLFAYRPELTHIDVKQVLIDSVDYSSSFQGLTVSEGIINLDKAFTLVMNWDSNAAPLTKQDTYTVVKNSVTSLNASQGLLSNDSDSDGDTLIASFAPEYLQGYITINRDGSFKYTAPKDFTGVDDFYYKVTDGKGKTSFAKVTMTIVDSVSNNNPTAINDNYSLNQDTTLTGNVLSNDSDVDGDSLTASVINNVTQGSLTLNSNGSFSYTPNANYFGTDSFTYQVSDGKGGFANATVTLTINQSVPTIPSIKLGNQYYAVEKYDTLQDSGSASVNASGELTLTGNAWKYIDLTGIGGVNITSDSLLAFDFKSDVAAEIQGVGFDNDRYMNNSANRAFQLTGIQRWGIQQFDNYSIGSGWKHYEIPIGEFFTGSFNYLTFFNDDDRANPTGISEFRNLELF